MALTRRQRSRLFRWLQYLVGIAILVVIAFSANWSQFA